MEEVLSFIAGGVVFLGAAYFLGRRPSKRGVALANELSTFLGKKIDQFPIVTRTFATVDLANLHLGITREAESRGTSVRVVGYKSPFGEHQNGLGELLSSEGRFPVVRVGPVQYRQVDVDVGKQMACVQNGLHLIDSAQGKLVAHVRLNLFSGALELQVMAATKELGSAFIEGVLESIRKANVYRGKVVSLEQATDRRGCGATEVRFHRLPALRAEEIILPAETKALIERNTVGFYKHADALRRSGRSLRRGILLHGKPGTGKTYTARWLAQALDSVTVILLSGEQLGLVRECCRMARMLAPALVIMEDVDLIASPRDETKHPFYQITLHQLLNEMDGVDSGAEVIFLLTTNRPEAIELALASRPGRVDQAIELPLPDAEGRRRLFELYGRGLELAVSDLERFIAKTDGASPAFIQELVRKSALIAAEEDSRHEGLLRVKDQHLEIGLRELVLGGGEVTRNLLGFGRT